MLLRTLFFRLILNLSVVLIFRLSLNLGVVLDFRLSLNLGMIPIFRLGHELVSPVASMDGQGVVPAYFRLGAF